MSRAHWPTRGAVLAIALFSTGCSVERLATKRIADALAAPGMVWTADDDPELVGAALPFSLKLMETVLAETPGHRALLAATAAAFTQYAWAFVQQSGDVAALDDSARAWAHWNRARRLYLRARDYGLRGLDVAHPGFTAGLRADREAAVRRAGPAEADLLYWTAASWAAAIALGKDDPALVAELGLVSALIDRVTAVDPDWDRGAIHVFLVSYAMARPDAASDRAAAARTHYARAVQLAQDRAAAPHVAWAEAVCLAQEDRACFDEAIAAALAVDVEAEPAMRLSNVVMKRRAAWLAEHVEHWILPPLPAEDGASEPPHEDGDSEPPP